MTTPITTFEDILQALERDPGLKDALRRHILTEELLQLPAAFAAFVEEQRSFNSRTESRLTNADARMGRMEQDMGTIKGYYAQSRMTADAPGIADDMGLTYTRTLTVEDLRQLANSQPMESTTRRSFRQADLIIEATDGYGERHFIAMEISYTADTRDSDRAVRNAGILTDLTGAKATAAIASVRNSNEVQELVQEGSLYWYEIEDRGPEQD